MPFTPDPALRVVCPSCMAAVGRQCAGLTGASHQQRVERANASPSLAEWSS